MQEKENVLDILERTKKAVKEEDVIALKDLSNRTVHTASINQDSDNIAVAVIVYSLSKLIERKKYQEFKNWDSFFNRYMSCIDNAIKALKEDNLQNFRECISEIRKEMNSLSGHLKNYIKDVFRKAQINKASRIYEHGISMEQTAKLLGISIWELAEYAGQTGISDVNLSVTMPIKNRIKIAEDMFK